MLCYALTDLDIAGRPEEYFIDFDHPEWKFWEDGPVGVRAGATNREEFLEAVWRAGTTENGVFGAKLMFNNMTAILNRFREMPRFAGRTRAEIFHSVFPDLHVVDVKRRDRARQAISWARMAQTGVYVLHAEQPRKPAGDCTYDFQFIQGLEQLIIEGEKGWAAFYDELDSEPFGVVYEDMITTAGFERTLRGLLSHIGVEATFDGLPPARSLVQSDEVTDEWLARYLADRR